MNDLLAYISNWSVLKWVVLVLIAGFIGQFGRMAAEAIAKKIRAGRPQQENKTIKPETPLQTPAPQPVSSGDLPDKKLLKAIAKAKKKETKKKE